MIKLGFRFDWRFESIREDYSSISMEELYDTGLGDLEFLVSGCDFSTRWGWVSAIQCALDFMELTDEIVRSGEAQTFGFLENTEVIRFERLLRNVRVTASYAPCQTIVPLLDLVICMRKFSKGVVRIASKERMGLLENPCIKELLSTPTVPPCWRDTVPK